MSMTKGAVRQRARRARLRPSDTNVLVKYEVAKAFEEAAKSKPQWFCTIKDVSGETPWTESAGQAVEDARQLVERFRERGEVCHNLLVVKVVRRVTVTVRTDVADVE